MNQTELALRFQQLHVPGNPLVLYNMWDAGSAKALADAGAPAVATGSWSVAGSLGYADGQALPMAALLQAVERMVACVEVPVSVDFEGAYAEAPDAVADNVKALMGLGVVGINFEDQIVGGSGLHAVDAQVERIQAIRAMAEAEGLSFFINARTDVYLKASKEDDPAALLAEATSRAVAYAGAGASGFFAPGLRALPNIATLCEASPLPVNVMVMGKMPSLGELTGAGVARVSHGPGPWRRAMADFAAGYGDATAQ